MLAELPAGRLEALIAEAQALRAPAGSILFDAKQPCRGFPLLLEGSVRVAKTAPTGREILLYRVEPGQGCILSGGCLLGGSDYSATGIAEADVALLSIPPAGETGKAIGKACFDHQVAQVAGGVHRAPELRAAPAVAAEYEAPPFAANALADGRHGVRDRDRRQLPSPSVSARPTSTSLNRSIGSPDL